MKILKKDLKLNEVTVMPQNLDDIWYLYNLIAPNDLVFALTHRTPESKGDKLRPESLEKKPMRLGVRVEKLEFQEFSDNLRIHGIIEEGPQDIGKYHTHSLAMNQSVSIIKPAWERFHLDSLDDAVRHSKEPRLTILAIDEREATIAFVHGYGVQKVATLHRDGGGKQFASKKDTAAAFFSAILDKLGQFGQGLPLVIIGPGFAREDFCAFGKEQKSPVLTHCITEGTGHAGMTGVNEALRRGIIEQISKDSRVAAETRIIEAFMAEVAKGGLADYGAAQVAALLDAGAVVTLLVIDELVREGSAAPLLDKAKYTNAEYHIISTSHEAGKQLKGIGGVGALLRFKPDV